MTEIVRVISLIKAMGTVFSPFRLTVGMVDNIIMIFFPIYFLQRFLLFNNLLSIACTDNVGILDHGQRKKILPAPTANQNAYFFLIPD